MNTPRIASTEQLTDLGDALQLIQEASQGNDFVTLAPRHIKALVDTRFFIKPTILSKVELAADNEARAILQEIVDTTTQPNPYNRGPNGLNNVAPGMMLKFSDGINKARKLLTAPEENHIMAAYAEKQRLIKEHGIACYDRGPQHDSWGWPGCQWYYGTPEQALEAKLKELGLTNPLTVA